MYLGLPQVLPRNRARMPGQHLDSQKVLPVEFNMADHRHIKSL